MTGWCDIRGRMISSPEIPRQNKAISEMRASPLRLVLASTSRYRKELLERLGLAFQTVAPLTHERPLSGEKPAGTALRLAQLKAQAGRPSHRDAVITHSEHVAAYQRRLLG